MPFALPFAMNGCGNFFVFDMRTRSKKVYGVAANNMGWNTDEAYCIANDFEELLTQTFTIDSVVYG